MYKYHVITQFYSRERWAILKWRLQKLRIFLPPPPFVTIKSLPFVGYWGPPSLPLPPSADVIYVVSPQFYQLSPLSLYPIGTVRLVISLAGTRASSPRSSRIVDPLVREKADTSFTMNSSDQNLLSQCNSRSGSKQSLVDSYSGQRRLSVAATATVGSEVASAGGSYRSQRTPGQSMIPGSMIHDLWNCLGAQPWKGFSYKVLPEATWDYASDPIQILLSLLAVCSINRPKSSFITEQRHRRQ